MTAKAVHPILIASGEFAFVYQVTTLMVIIVLVSTWYKSLLPQWRDLDSETRTTTSTRFSQYWVLLTREPASIWPEKRHEVIAIVILLLS